VPELEELIDEAAGDLFSHSPSPDRKDAGRLPGEEKPGDVTDDKHT
jgi:hypothetical protein